MKKMIVVAACAVGYACGAHAQTSVTLHGVIDSSLVYTSNQAGQSDWQTASGTVTGSHWGLSGQEDLGQGTKAIFQLESGFSVMNGSLRQGGRLFGYQAYTGLSDDQLGQVTFGRQYDSVVDYLAPLSFTGGRPGGNNLSAHPFDNDNLNNSFRVDNAVKYTSISYAGFKFGSLYGFSNEAGGFANNRLYSFGASYDAGPLSLAAAGFQINNGGVNNTSGALTLTDRTFIAARQQTFGAGINYSIDAAKLGFVWTRTQLGGFDTLNGSNSLGIPENGGNTAFNNYEVNVRYSVTPNLKLNSAYTYTDASMSNASGEHHPQWNEISVQADYFLSQRTDVYVQTSYQRINSDGSGLTADISGQNFSSNDQQMVVAAGLRHRF